MKAKVKKEKVTLQYPPTKRWRVASICIDLPAVVNGGDRRRYSGVSWARNENRMVVPESKVRVEVVDDPILFGKQPDVWAVADMYEAFWNRLNDDDITRPFGAHRADQLVKVLWVEGPLS